MKEHLNKTLGCLGKIASFIFVMIIVSGIRTYIKKQISNRQSIEAIESTATTSHNKNEYSKEEIEIAVAETRLNLPRRIDDYTTAVDMQCTDKAVIYIYNVDAEIDITEIDAGMMKQSIQETFDNENPMTHKLALFCISTGRKWKYIYKSAGSDDKIEFSFSPEELKQSFW